MNLDNLCIHAITMRVWRQSSETRQAVLDAQKQAIRDEVVFGNGLEASAESGKSTEGPRVGALEALTARPEDAVSLPQGNSVQRVAAQYEAATIATS